MRTKLTRSLLTAAALALAGCPVGAPYVDGFQITCTKDSDCQPSFNEVCDLKYGLCVAGPDAGFDGGTDAGPAVCVINGQTFDAGTFEPGQGCSYCDPLNPGVWSKLTGLASPSACAQVSDVCTGGVCSPGCIVGGEFVPAGGTGSNVCQICNPSLSQTALQDQTYVPDGGCGAAQVCSAGQCASGCIIDGGFAAAGSAAVGNPCIACNPAVSLTSYDTSFTGLAADGGCGASDVCDQGACAAGCYIDNAFVAPNTANGSDSCESCTPAQVVSNWTNAADGTACTGNGGYYCQNGQCENVCDIAGQLLSNGSSDPANTCQSCQTANDPTNWSPVTVGAVTCSSNGGNYCVEGSCALACDISGAVLDAGALDTTNGCQSCQPSLAATAFSPVADGTTCSTGGTYCVGGNCAKDCEIGGVLLADGTIDGGNPNVCCSVGVSSMAWTAGFAAASASPSTGTSPEGIAIGDLNGDGKADLAVANYGDATVGILYGQGAGAFAAQVTFPVGTLPQAVALADLNADTLPDIAVANNGAATVSVLLNQGDDGGFEPAPGSPDAIGGKATAIGVGHFGTTTSEDIVVADLGVAGASGNEVSVLLNSGSGGFATALRYQVGTRPSAVAVTDFDLDGFDDLAVANSSDGTVTTLSNNGNGTFSVQSTLTVGTGTSPAGIVALDINGDGKPDLAVTCNGTNDVRVFLNTGTGWSAMQGPFAVGTAPQGIVAGNFNGNGASQPDLAVVNNVTGTISVLINQTPTSAANAAFAIQATYSVGSGPVTIAMGLLNADTLADLAVTNNNANTVSVLLGQCP